MLVELYIVLGLVFALMHLIDDRSKSPESSFYSASRADPIITQKICVITSFIGLWPLIVIGWILYKLTHSVE